MAGKRAVQKRRYADYFDDDGEDRKDLNACNESRLKSAAVEMKKKQKLYEENNFEPVKSEGDSEDEEETLNRFGKLNGEIEEVDCKEEPSKKDEEKIELTSKRAYFKIEKRLQLMNGFFKFIKTNSDCLAKIAKYMNN